MKEFLESLFSGNGFMPHGHCYLWTPGVVWLHVISDGLIALAYFSIPITLAWFVRRRRDIDFRWMFVCFAVFILACGTTHLMEIWNVWHGTYWLSGVVKAAAAAASVPTAILLTRLMPQALTLPSPAALARTNATGEPFEMDFPLRGADSRYRWFLTRAFPLKDAAGRVLRWCGTNTDIGRIREAEMEIQRLNTDLEKRVVERTAQLEAANRELEAFSYSVSHDLRAPLRAMDGFSQAVLEDCAPDLTEEGRRYLRTIRGEAQRMGTLIDDLLAFSRLSRAPLTKQTVNTGGLVRSVLDDLKAQREGRHVELRIGELPACAGDPALLRQVWVNLLSNALKYTQKRPVAVVEIGCDPTPEGDVFFVRDNGTGFDMRYAGKLFGVFQRLHRAEEYEGTGVGLAIVQRVIHRHGGRVWAEAAADRGATFYFTLGKETQP